MKSDNIMIKAGKGRKILLASLAAVLVCGIAFGAFLVFRKHFSNRADGTGNKAITATAADTETLRELLLKDGNYIITIDGILEVNEGFYVNGIKTLAGNGTLRMKLDSEWGQSLLTLSEKASLTMAGPTLDCNYVADGIDMDKDANLICKSGTITCSSAYSIHARGKVDMKNFRIEKAEYIALFADDGSQIEISGGKFTDNSTNDIYVQKDASVRVSKPSEFTGCMGNSVENYGTLNVTGGKFSDVVLYTFNNFGELKVNGGENYDVECSKSRLGVFCTRGGAVSEISGVTVEDTTAQAVVTVGGETEISDCKFAKTGGHTIESQKGTVAVKNVSIASSGKDGIEVYTNGDVTAQDVTISQCEGIGIAVRGGKLNGSDLTVSSCKKYGISCGNSENGKASATLGNVKVENTEKSGFYVYNSAAMDLTDIESFGSGSRGIYIEDTASLTLSGDSKIHHNKYRGIEARGKFVMNDGKVYDNQVENSGAGVYVSEKGAFTMNGGSIYHNASGLRGGGICVNEGTVTINQGEVYGNTAKDNGGGLYAQKAASITLKSGEIRDNTSQLYGNGIYAASAATRVELGEGFYVGGNDIKLGNVETSIKISGKKLSKHSVSDPLLLTPDYKAAENTVLAVCEDENTAKSLASMVKAGDGSYEVKQSAQNFVVGYATADMDMTGADTVYVSDFAELKNAVLSTKAKRNIIVKADIRIEERLRLPGGVTIAIKDDGNKRTLSRMDGFSDNMFVTHYGTGLYLDATQKGNLILDGEFVSNDDTRKAQPLVRTAGSTVLRNVMLQNNGSAKKGTTVRGAFLRQLYGDFKVYNSTFKNGQCESGGAIMLDKGKGYIENSLFTENKTVIGGGALRAAAGTGLEIVDSQFSKNYAGTAGGAIVAVGGAEVTVTDTSFDQNTAENFAGALLAQDEGTVLTLKGSRDQKAFVKGNSAKTIGAVCVQSKAHLTVDGYVFEENEAVDGRAGAIASNQKGVAVLKNSRFYRNQASGSGGAVSVDCAELTAISCEFGKENAGNVSGDKGGAILVTGNGMVTMDGENHNALSRMAYNRSVVGGAICVYGGQALVKDYQFAGNEARDGGGAIYIQRLEDTSSNAMTEGCKFIKNTTPSNGGAVHSKGLFTDQNSEFTENSAKNGGAIIAIGGGTINMKGSGARFSANTASAKGNAIFVQSDGSIAEISGYSFEENASHSVAANGTVIFDNLPGATIVQGTKGVLKASGHTNADKITITPSDYRIGKVVLTKADGVSEDAFQEACRTIKITKAGTRECFLDENGKLITTSVARIGDQKYATLEEALKDANKNGGTIYLTDNVTIHKQLSITANVTICNEQGKNITISRSGDIVMFNVTNTMHSLVLGSDDLSGSLTIDASTAAKATKRVIDNSGTFTLAANATIQNANSSVWGNVLINRTGVANLYGSILNNTSSGACGAILQNTAGGKVIFHAGNYANNNAVRVATSKVDSSFAGLFYVNDGTVEILGGTFRGNSSTGYGSVGYGKPGKEIILSGGVFDPDQSIYIGGTATVSGSPDGVPFLMGENGVIRVAEGANVEKVVVTPYAYQIGKTVLTKADGVSEDAFHEACQKLTLTQPNGQRWFLNEQGRLATDDVVARIENTYYGTLDEAITAANQNGGVIFLNQDAVLSKTVTITKNVTICNEPGVEVTISRNSDKQMFTVESGAKLTLGRNDAEADGRITVNGAIAAASKTRLMNNKGTFILGRNATLTGAVNNQWGCVLVNSGTAELYGCIKDNVCTGAGGAVLQNGGSITIFDGTYCNNTATRPASGGKTASLGGFMRVEKGTVTVAGGTFAQNKTTGDGNAIWVKENATVTVTGGVFEAGQNIYVLGTLNMDQAVNAEVNKGNGGVVNMTGGTDSEKPTLLKKSVRLICSLVQSIMI